jgi:hypothetical protein
MRLSTLSVQACWALALLTLGALGSGCSGPTPPARWAQGGTRLDLPQARWRYDGDSVEIRSRGSWAEIVVDGDTAFVLDRVGRVYTKHREPYALLEPDGRLVGKDETLLGMVGSMNAALPGRANAWISVTPAGQVIKYDGGQGSDAGHWLGCAQSPWTAQACVLASYLLYYRDEGAELDANQPAMMTPGFGTSIIVAP